MKLPKKQRTEITIETRSVTIIRTRGKRFSAVCEHCQKKTEAVTVEEFAERLNTTPQNVYSLIQTGDLHFLETAGNARLPLVCRSSANARLTADFRFSF